MATLKKSAQLTLKKTRKTAGMIQVLVVIAAVILVFAAINKGWV